MNSTPGSRNGTGEATPHTAQVVELVETWLRAARETESPRQRRRDRQLAGLLEDPDGLGFAMAFIDRVMRAPTNRVAAAQLHDLVRRRGNQAFLSPVDQVLLRAGAALAPRLPAVVLPLAVRRIRALTGHLVIAAEDPALQRHLQARAESGIRTNLNRLGEAILGEQEATRRLERTVQLLARDDVDYVSVKISAIASRLNLWSFERSVERIANALRPIYHSARQRSPVAFVNLDMEEYHDLHLTIAAFRRVLDEEPFKALPAGIVLQAYLPDSFDALRQLVAWSTERHAHHGGEIKIRIVKGANLAMERVDAEVHGWPQAPYPNKLDVDANWKRLLDWCFRPEHLTATRIGIASHNLFDVAWAHLLAQQRGVSDRVGFEMLEGMAPAHAAQVRNATGAMLLYTPIVGADEFPSAIAYLFRRLEENAAPQNFLRHLFDLDPASDTFAEQRHRFERSLAARWQVSSEPRRTQNRFSEQPEAAHDAPFVNEADTDPALHANRRWIHAAFDRWQPLELPAVASSTGEADEAVAAAKQAAIGWAAVAGEQRARHLERAAAMLARRRGALLATMAHEAGKVVAEGDPEISEAIDFARYYAAAARRLDHVDGARFEPLGVVVVTPPWNFPVAIAAGGVLAALAAGNAVIVKPPPQTPMCVKAMVDALYDAGLPSGVLTYLRTPDDDVGRRLVTHPDVDAVILTGAWDTANLFRSWKPDIHLVAETSGKNAMIITARADLDAAVADLVASSFGHAGQKCSAASLAIVEAAMHDSEAFLRQLRDAVQSLAVGPAVDLGSDLGPLIGQPDATLHRALHELESGERWLVAPECLSDDRRLWRPGVKLGVKPGSWFHHTECFGPVLGVMRADNLRQATEWQNEVPFGLTGGLWSLDPDEIAWWLDHVEVGNAYVNRRTTGAIVGRQPFGGWKRSTVGPGAKAGGPNYAAQFGRWTDASPPVDTQAPSPPVRELLAAIEERLADAGEPFADSDRAWLHAAAQSDAWHWAREFSARHDPCALVSEANEFRYVPLRRVLLRFSAPVAPAVAVARLVAAARCCGVEVVVSLDDAASVSVLAPVLNCAGVATVLESDTTLADRLEHLNVDHGLDRMRACGPLQPELRLAASALGIHVETAQPVRSGRVELLRWVREQAISRTLHRYGNLIGTPKRGSGR